MTAIARTDSRARGVASPDERKVADALISHVQNVAPGSAPLGGVALSEAVDRARGRASTVELQYPRPPIVKRKKRRRAAVVARIHLGPPPKCPRDSHASLAGVARAEGSCPLCRRLGLRERLWRLREFPRSRRIRRRRWKRFARQGGQLLPISPRRWRTVREIWVPHHACSRITRAPAGTPTHNGCMARRQSFEVFCGRPPCFFDILSLYRFL